MTKPINQLASVTYNVISGVSWETASDWNDSIDEAGVVHEGFGDYPGDNAIQLGYPSFDRGGDALLSYWPGDGDSGDLTDIVGGYDGTLSGPSYGATGLHNTTTLDYDGASDYTYITDSTPYENNDSFTLQAWTYARSYGGSDLGGIFGKEDTGSNSGFVLFFWDNAGYVWRTGDGDWTNVESSNHDTNQWVHHVATYDNGSMQYWINGSSVGTNSDTLTDVSNDLHIGCWASDNSRSWDGRIECPMFFNRAVTDSEVQDLYDAGTTGHLETNTKSLSIAGQPDLTDLDYDLNGETIDVDVIGSPGTTDEEIVTQTLDGSTSYTLSWANTHTDFRVRPQFNTSDLETSPVVRQIGLFT